MTKNKLYFALTAVGIVIALAAFVFVFFKYLYFATFIINPTVAIDRATLLDQEFTTLPVTIKIRPGIYYFTFYRDGYNPLTVKEGISIGQKITILPKESDFTKE